MRLYLLMATLLVFVLSALGAGRQQPAAAPTGKRLSKPLSDE